MPAGREEEYADLKAYHESRTPFTEVPFGLSEGIDREFGSAGFNDGTADPVDTRPIPTKERKRTEAERAARMKAFEQAQLKLNERNRAAGGIDIDPEQEMGAIREIRREAKERENMFRPLDQLQPKNFGPEFATSDIRRALEISRAEQAKRYAPILQEREEPQPQPVNPVESIFELLNLTGK